MVMIPPLARMRAPVSAAPEAALFEEYERSSITPELFERIMSHFSPEARSAPRDRYTELRGHGFEPRSDRGRLFNWFKYMADSGSGTLDRNLAAREAEARDEAHRSAARRWLAEQALSYQDKLGERAYRLAMRDLSVRQHGETLNQRERLAQTPRPLDPAMKGYYEALGGRARSEGAYTDWLKGQGLTKSGEKVGVAGAPSGFDKVKDDKMIELVREAEQDWLDIQEGTRKVGREKTQRGAFNFGFPETVDVYTHGTKRTVAPGEYGDYEREAEKMRGSVESRLQGLYDEMERRGIPVQRLVGPSARQGRRYPVMSLEKSFQENFYGDTYRQERDPMMDSGVMMVSPPTFGRSDTRPHEEPDAGNDYDPYDNPPVHGQAAPSAVTGGSQPNIDSGPHTNPEGSIEPRGRTRERTPRPMQPLRPERPPPGPEDAARGRGPASSDVGRRALTLPNPDEWKGLDPASQAFYSILEDWQARGIDIERLDVQADAAKMARDIGKPGAR